jgi:cob(I)alamin adenosyltransferase
MDGTDDDEHAARARGALARAEEIVAGASGTDLDSPLDPDGAPADGVHMLIVDEILYAANRGLVEPDDVVDLIERKPAKLELVLTGGHERPEYLIDHADLVSNVTKEKHPLDDGHPARKGTEY